MPHFVLTLHDAPDSAATRAEYRPEHLDYLWSHDDAVLVAGALMDEAGETPVGSHMLLEMDDVAAVEAFADGDPFHREGVFARRSITRFRPAPHPGG